MGISTVIIGLLPGCATIGIFAPRCCWRWRVSGQELGLGGGMGRRGALLATENAPPRKRAVWLLPQLGAPIRLLLCQWHLPVLSLAADRRAVYELGAACVLSSSAVLR